MMGKESGLSGKERRLLRRNGPSTPSRKNGEEVAVTVKGMEEDQGVVQGRRGPIEVEGMIEIRRRKGKEATLQRPAACSTTTLLLPPQYPT
jgi:predicted membrane GTPase involved in stress response